MTRNVVRGLTWTAYLEHRRELGDPEAKSRPAARKHRQFPSLLEPEIRAKVRAAQEAEADPELQKTVEDRHGD
jgi:hypothetical protein